MELTAIKDLYRDTQKYVDQKVTIGGWVRSNRDSKTFGFLVVNDGTFFETLQVVTMTRWRILRILPRLAAAVP